MKRYFLIACATAFILLGTSFRAQAQTSAEPELPRIYLSTSYPATGGTIRNVAASGDLQAALNLAQPGDTIVLQAGTVYSGNFTLPAKSGNGWIIIRSSNMGGLPAEGTRVSPAQATAMPKIVTPNAAPAIATLAGAHHYRLVGLEIGIASKVAINHGIVSLGDGGTAQNSLETVPHNLVIDRCYVHGNATGDVSRGIALNSASTAVIDSYISECHGVGFDTQAIGGWNGPGPYKIVNNYLEGAGENIMFGGVDPKIVGLVPSDIEFRRNLCSKPLSWNPYHSTYAGIHWSVKNIFELKNAQRVLIDGNIFENNWVDGQAGVAILFTPRNQEGTAPWSAVQDVTFTNNILRHSAAGIHFLGRDYNYTSQQARRFKIKNNLFYDIGGAQWGGSGRLFLLIDGPADIQIDHNTAMHTSNIITADGPEAAGLVYTNNITPNNDFGVIGSGRSPGNDTIKNYFPGCVFAKNVIIAGPGHIYPADNFFPSSVAEVGFLDMAGNNYRLATGSPFKRAGTDGQDIGANQELIEASIGGQQPPPQTNQLPVVKLTASAVSGIAPLEVSFTADGSDSDGFVDFYIWDFGDKQSSGAAVSQGFEQSNASTPAYVTHVYQTAGTFTARVTVTDNQGATATASVLITVTNKPLPPASEIVLHTSQASVKAGDWKPVVDAAAAVGIRMWNPDASAPKLNTAFASPTHYFEMTFTAQAGVPYRLWMRGKADSNSTNNDSAFVQFSSSTDSTGAAVFRIGTTSATMFNLEDCTGCGLSNWGWNDNAFGGMGPLIYFATSGAQTIRVQMREDGLSIDQVVLSPEKYLNTSPGAARNDSTILPTSNTLAAPSLLTIMPSSGTTAGGNSVTISGSGFAPGATVTVGGIAVSSATVISSSSIMAVMPANAAGAVDIVVTNVDGLSGSVVKGYTYVAPNLSPVVKLTASAVSGVAPLSISFAADASDPDGSIDSYFWEFGDGQTSTQPNVSHVYKAVGMFTARVTVTDNRGGKATASIVIDISEPISPVVEVLHPNGGNTLLINSACTITWSVSGDNISSQSIDLSLDGGLSWRKVVGNLPGNARSYNWLVPKSTSRSARIRIRVLNSAGAVGEDMSDSNFSITNRSKK